MDEKITHELALRELVDTIMEGGSGCEIDAGCNGEGPVARALVALGDYETCEEASKAIWPDEDFEDQ